MREQDNSQELHRNQKSAEDGFVDYSDLECKYSATRRMARLIQLLVFDSRTSGCGARYSALE